MIYKPSKLDIARSESCHDFLFYLSNQLFGFLKIFLSNQIYFYINTLTRKLAQATIMHVDQSTFNMAGD